MKAWSGWLGVALALVFSWAVPAAAQLEHIANHEAAAGLRAALEKGSTAAVKSLGRQDGFFRNAKVKIPLPDTLKRAESLMRRFGMGEHADELILAINRAAEAAVPEARQLFVDAVRGMTLQDAKSILTGGDTAGTDYFRKTTRSRLHQRFLPIVRASTEKVALAQQYNRYAERAAALGLLDEKQADLDDYVTRKALDGLYATIAEEEKKIRKDPVRAGASIIRKVFGALQ